MKKYGFLTLIVTGLGVSACDPPTAALDDSPSQLMSEVSPTGNPLAQAAPCGVTLQVPSDVGDTNTGIIFVMVQECGTTVGIWYGAPGSPSQIAPGIFIGPTYTFVPATDYPVCVGPLDSEPGARACYPVMSADYQPIPIYVYSSPDPRLPTIRNPGTRVPYRLYVRPKKKVCNGEHSIGCEATMGVRG